MRPAARTSRARAAAPSMKRTRTNPDRATSGQVVREAPSKSLTARRNAALQLLGRGVSSRGLPREEGLLALDPGREARPRQDRIHVCKHASVPTAVDLTIEMVEVGEWARHRDVGERDAVAHQELAGVGDGPLEIIEDRRKLLLLRGLGDAKIAFSSEEARRD